MVSISVLLQAILHHHLLSLLVIVLLDFFFSGLCCLVCRYTDRVFVHRSYWELSEDLGLELSSNLCL